MPFDYEEYKRKCSELSPEELQKEWENYTRQLAGGATSTAGSVLFAPFTAGVSLVGLGLSAPRVHNARKKREIIETYLQAHGTTHHTRKRDIAAPMAIAGTLGGLTLGLAGPGADLLAGEVAGKGIEYAVSHTALEVASATLEHKHVEHKKTKEQLKLAEKYGSAAAPTIDQEATYQLSPKVAQQLKYQQLRKSKSEDRLHGLAYVPPPYQLLSQEKLSQNSPQQFQQDQGASIALTSDSKDSSLTKSYIQGEPANVMQEINEKDKNPETRSGPGLNLPYFGLLDHEEAEKRGLQWDATRGIYVQPGNLNSLHGNDPSPASHTLQADAIPVQGQSDELDDLMSQLLAENSVAPENSAGHSVETSVEAIHEDPLSPAATALSQDGHSDHLEQFPSPPPLPPRVTSEHISHLSPSENNHGLNIAPIPPNVQRVETPVPSLWPQIPVLPPRPKSSIGSYSTSMNQPARIDQYFYPPPPPPQQKDQQQVGVLMPPQRIPPSPQPSAPVTAQLQYIPQQYNPQHYSPLPAQPYQPIHIQQPPHQTGQPQHPPPSPLRRPSPRPLQHQDSTSASSSISTATSISSPSSLSLTSTPTLSTSSTPLTSYSTLTPQSSYDPSTYNTSFPKPASSTNPCPSPQPSKTAMYFPPPPTTAGKERDYF